MAGRVRHARPTSAIPSTASRRLSRSNQAPDKFTRMSCVSSSMSETMTGAPRMANRIESDRPQPAPPAPVTITARFSSVMVARFQPERPCSTRDVTIQNSARLAERTAKNNFKDSVIANAAIAAANPQYHDSAQNPAAQSGRRPPAGTRGRSAGMSRGTRARYAA
jgi:hypothetical protein